MSRDNNSAIQKLIEGTEELLRRTASVGEEKIEANQSRLKRHWDHAASRAHDWQDAAGEGVRTLSKKADGVVHRHAWESIGIAALIGAVVAGCILTQKKRR